MTSVALHADAATSPWRRHGIALVLVVAALLLLFAADVARLVGLWWTSTTFGHCLFIGPVIGWLVWQRRAELAALTPAAWWPGLALVGAGSGAWLLGEAGSVAFARQFGLLAMVEGAVVALLGAQVARGLLFPLGYAVFLVPFGTSIEAPLQTLTVAEVMPLLRWAGVPAASNGVLIRAGDQWFEVAEACSGAKFVLAMLAFAVLVAQQCFRSWRRRIAFVAVALAVPVAANGLRAFATIYAAHRVGVAAATGFDHIVYGWMFFALVMAAVVAAWWRAFDRPPDDPAFDPATLPGAAGGRAPLWLAAAAVLAGAAAAPFWTAAIARAAPPLPATIALPDLAGWRRGAAAGAGTWRPFYPGADRIAMTRYTDAAGDAVDLAVVIFASQSEGRELVGFGTGVLREGGRWVRVDDPPPIAGGAAVRIVAPGTVERVVATWYRVGDVLTADPALVKWQTAKTRLVGGPPRALAIHLSARVRAGRDPAAAIARLHAALGPFGARADGWAGAR